jgi:fumarate hydratase, class II
MTTANDEEPKILDVPIGLDAHRDAKEFDSLGAVEVSADHYWGAQTQRSLEHFNIGHDRMPKELYHAYGYVKKAAAIVNTASGRLPAWKGKLIERVCDVVISGALDAEFPLYVFQTGSGTQSNVNVNEVISNRCIQLVGSVIAVGVAYVLPCALTRQSQLQVRSPVLRRRSAGSGVGPLPALAVGLC